MITLSNPTGIERIANLEDMELSYTRAGNGAPVVLVHGSVVDGRVWSSHSNALATTFDVVVPTQRYFGIRAWTDEGTNFSVGRHAKDLANFLKY